MRYALVRDGIVENVIVAGESYVCDDPEVTVVPLDDDTSVGPGWQLVDGEFVPPENQPNQAVQVQPVTRMTKYQFRRRFTLDELVRFDNPELFIQMTPQQRAIANTLQRSFEVATEIDLTDPILHYGMQLMVDWGLLTNERRQQILDPSYTPPTP